jgi:hypothetical protein
MYFPPTASGPVRELAARDTHIQGRFALTAGNLGIRVEIFILNP